MAEMIFRDMALNRGLSDLYKIWSMAVSSEELGNDIYPPAKRVLARHGIEYLPHKACKVSREDMDAADLVVVMDERNLRDLHSRFGSDFDGKTVKILSFCGIDADVSDPWYTGDFETAYLEIRKGCEAILDTLEEKNFGKE